MHMFASPKPALALKHKIDSLNTCMEAAETNSEVVEGPLAAGTRSHSHPKKAGQKPDSHLRSLNHVLSILQWEHLLCPSVCLWHDRLNGLSPPEAMSCGHAPWLLGALLLTLIQTKKVTAWVAITVKLKNANACQCSLHGYSLFRIRKELKTSLFLGLHIYATDQRQRQSNG